MNFILFFLQPFGCDLGELKRLSKVDSLCFVPKHRYFVTKCNKLKYLGLKLNKSSKKYIKLGIKLENCYVKQLLVDADFNSMWKVASDHLYSLQGMVKKQKIYDVSETLFSLFDIFEYSSFIVQNVKFGGSISHWNIDLLSKIQWKRKCLKTE